MFRYQRNVCHCISICKYKAYLLNYPNPIKQISKFYTADIQVVENLVIRKSYIVEFEQHDEDRAA